MEWIQSIKMFNGTKRAKETPIDDTTATVTDTVTVTPKNNNKKGAHQRLLKVFQCQETKKIERERERERWRGFRV